TQTAITGVNVTGTALTSATNTTAGTFSFIHSAGILDIGDNAALGTGGLDVSAAATIWANGAARTLNNGVYLAAIATTLGGRRDYGGNFGLTLAGPVTLVGAAAGSTFQTDDPLTPATVSGTISQSVANNFFLKTGIGTLTVTGNNTFSGSPV